MSNSNNSFRWIDRDTAARDLLHLYENNIPFLRDRIERLLYAVRSPAVIPDLLEIALDNETTGPVVAVIWGVIAVTGGNYYLSDIERIEARYSFVFNSGNSNFLKNHPVNKEQFLKILLGRFSRIDDTKTLYNGYEDFLEHFPDIFAPRLTQLIDDNPKLFDLDTAAHLRQYASEYADEWLHTHWDDLIYLCLIDGKRDRNVRSHSQQRLVRILEDWPELKEDLFQRCPAIIEEYSLRKSAFEMRFQPEARIHSTYAWQELEMEFGLVLQKGEDECRQFLRKYLYHSNKDITYGAGAMYLVGTVLDRYPSIVRDLEFALEYIAGQWRDVDDYEMQIHYPVRFEAANALRKIITASTWEHLVVAYLKQPFKELIPWIADITDQLSGVDVTPSAELALERRPWFRALAEAEGVMI